MEENWPDYVRRILQEHGVTQRGQRRRTAVPHSTIGGWYDGIPPRYENVVAFARGMGEDVNYALRVAGYEPIAAEPSPDARLGAGIRDLAERYDSPTLALKRFTGLGNLTHEKVNQLLAELEEDLRAEQEEERQADERRRQQGGGGAR